MKRIKAGHSSISLRERVERWSQPLNIRDTHLRRHVTESELLPTHTHCPACGEPQRAHHTIPVQRDPDIGFSQCVHCHAYSATRMPTDEFLRAYYRDYFASDTKVSFQDYNRFYRHMDGLGLFENISGERPYRILDFGGGDGSLSLALAYRLIQNERVKRVHITLVDFHAPAPSPSMYITITTHASLAEIPKGSQDMVLASGVLEHVTNLAATSPLLFSVLAPQAKLYARVPYAVPMRRLVASYDLQFPMHVHDLGPRFWNHVPQRYEVSLLHSQPSIVKTPWRMPHVTVLATLMKLPTHLQLRTPWLRRMPLFWPFVGGWEVVLRK